MTNSGETSDGYVPIEPDGPVSSATNDDPNALVQSIDTTVELPKGTPVDQALRIIGGAAMDEVLPPQE